MMNLPTHNTYQSITLWHYTDGSTCHTACLYTSVENVKLNQHLWVDYKAGKQELAKLMLRLGKMPEVRHYDGFTCYDLHGFLD